MQAPTDDDLIGHIDAFLERTGMKPTRFGLDAMGEGNLIKSLREGRSLSLRNVQRVLDYMRGYEAEPVHDAGTASPCKSDDNTSVPERDAA